uniref:Anoctamin n=1 Tax=Parascaris univalens TaxID=6257 RepID=A0A914ZLA4_PARUN
MNENALNLEESTKHTYVARSPFDASSSPSECLLKKNSDSRHHQCRKPRISRGDCFDCGSLMMDAAQGNDKSAISDNIELNEPSDRRTLSPTRYHSWRCKPMFFSDGIRRVDYVLAYETKDSTEESSTDEDITAEGTHDVRTQEEKRASKRHRFEENLCKLGLELERVEGKERTIIDGMLDKFLNKFPFFTFSEETNERLKEPNYFTAPFITDHLECYVGSDDPNSFFESSERSRMVYDLLLRTRYDAEEVEKYRVGIERLVKNGTYTAAYPLHEPCEEPEYDVNRCSNREMLYWNWCRYNNFYKYQPLSLIRKYFGSKIGIYFAWLGYYTKVLFPASVAGVLCFLFGLFTYSQDIPSNDICGSDGIGAVVMMCPTCDKYCAFTPLNASCVYSKLSYIFDNNATVLFAALMSIGATLFLEGWKRYHAELAWKWGLLDFEVDEETVRPEYQLRVKEARTKRLNPITQEMEPYMPFRQRILRFFASSITVIFFLLLVVAFVVGVVVYRIVLLQVLYRVDGMKQYASILTFTTAATLNLIVILILSYFYTFLALKLTDWECPRTQTEFDNSYTFKVYLFQFINYYSSIFYIAFIKGNISSVPGRRILGLRPEECDPAGCMVELVIQLAIIMCGKQFWNAFVEIAWPLVRNMVRSWWMGMPETKRQKSERLRREKRLEIECAKTEVPRWERDYVLNPVYDQFLFDEYLEMVIQFGFVTLFVSAFPLAPLFALLNNIMEIRLDAYKFLITTRRPLPERAKDIGIWLPILDGISKAAVLINAFVIAFTSDFVPKFVYRWVYHHQELYGYVNNSLSIYDARSMAVWSDFDLNITTCRFRDYRNPPCSVLSSDDCSTEYSVTTQWWIVLTFRLAFVLVFEHVVSAVKAFVAYIIPDMPSKIFIQLQRQRFLARQARLYDIGNAASAKSATNDKHARSKGHAASSDRDDVAFQPGLFDKGDEKMPRELQTVMQGDLRRRSTLISSSAPSLESFQSCNVGAVDTNGMPGSPSSGKVSDGEQFTGFILLD